MDYRELRRREETFRNWPLSNPTAKAMAQASFIYTGERDTVECFACGIKLSDWSRETDPRLRHRLSAPACPMMEEDEGLVDETSSVYSGASGVSGATGYTDDSGLGGMQRARPSNTATRMPTIDASGESSTVLSARSTANPNRRRRPRSPAPVRYKQMEERKKSFEHVPWPSNIEAQPDKLVKAGFFYIGPGDRVKCAFCFGKLKNWLPNDSAIEEHIRHFPDCTFVQNIEKQTEVLSKNIRSKRKTDNCVSADELMKQYKEEREKELRPKRMRTLWRTTLRKMGFSEGLIKKGEKSCLRHFKELNLENIMDEIHVIEKNAFFERANSSDGSNDEGMESGSEDELTSQESSLEHLSIEDQVKQLEQELRGLNNEKEQLQNQMTCKICLSSPANTLFLTCRHFITCHACADRVRDCPMCRQLILGTVDVFIPDA